MSNMVIVYDLDDQVLATFGPNPAELPQVIEGTLGVGTPVRMSFTGSGARDALAGARPAVIEASDLLNGQPSQAFDRTRHAQTQGSGRIVRMSYPDRGQVRSDTGILTLVAERAGPGGPKVQQVDVVFYPMPPGSTLWGPTGDIIDRVPLDDDEEGS